MNSETNSKVFNLMAILTPVKIVLLQCSMQAVSLPLSCCSVSYFSNFANKGFLGSKTHPRFLCSREVRKSHKNISGLFAVSKGLISTRRNIPFAKTFQSFDCLAEKLRRSNVETHSTFKLNSACEQRNIFAWRIFRLVGKQAQSMIRQIYQVL